MIDTIKKDIVLKKDYNRESLSRYFCNLIEIKYIDFFDPFIFWDVVKFITFFNSNSLEIHLKDCNWGTNRYYIRFVNSGIKGEFFNDLEYGILYIIAKSFKKQIELYNLLKLENPQIRLDENRWEEFKQTIRNIAFERFYEKKGR